MPSLMEVKFDISRNRVNIGVGRNVIIEAVSNIRRARDGGPGLFYSVLERWLNPWAGCPGHLCPTTC